MSDELEQACREWLSGGICRSITDASSLTAFVREQIAKDTEEWKADHLKVLHEGIAHIAALEADVKRLEAENACVICSERITRIAALESALEKADELAEHYKVRDGSFSVTLEDALKNYRAARATTKVVP